jgi:hypothetical protein
MKIGNYSIWIFISVIIVCISFITNVKQNIETFTDEDVIKKNFELGEKAARNYMEFQNNSCGDTKYYQLKNQNDIKNYVSEESGTFLTLNSKEGIYDKNLDMCSNPDGFDTLDNVCSTNMTNHCYNSKNESEEMPFETDPYLLFDGKTQACKSSCDKICLSKTPCWKMDNSNIKILNRHKLHNCVDSEDDETIDEECAKEPTEYMCPQRTYYTYTLSQDGVHNILSEDAYISSLVKRSDDEYECSYNKRNDEKEVFDTLNDATDKCKDFENEKRCYYLQKDGSYKHIDHKLDFLTCSYNNDTSCITTLDDSVCTASNLYYKMTESKYIDNSKVDIYESMVFKEKLKLIEPGTHQCVIDVPEDYNKDITCDYDTECYSSSGPVKPYINSKGERKKDTCVFKDCLTRDDSLSMTKARNIVSNPKGAACAIKSCEINEMMK